MNHMNMAGMNPGTPAMGGMPTMSDGTNGMQLRQPDGSEEINYESRLNSYIYGYFMERQMWEPARALKNSGAGFEPPLQADGEMNGADEKPDTKDGIAFKRPDDLPRNPEAKDGNSRSFLLGWFELFWDVFWAQKKNPLATPMTANYVQLTQAQARRNDQQQQQMLRGMPAVMQGNMNFQDQMMRQGQMMGMNAADLRQRVLSQRGGLQPGNLQRDQRVAAMYQQQVMSQMRRDGSDMNGRPRTPSGADHAPSPSKRQRIDGVQFNGQPMMPNGRGMPPGMAGQQMMHDPQAAQANQLLMNNGINPGNLSDTQFASFQQQNPSVQQKSIQVYAQNMSKHQRDLSKVGGMSDQGSPMIGPGMDPGANGSAEFYANNPAAAMGMRNPGMPPQPPGANGAGGNHALQDYQMQLMLLEQQNKKRLLMARQEQDSITRPEVQPGMPGQAGFAQGMSPSGSRGGPSPQPDQLRRNTPKMNQPGMPGSPMPDGRMTGSPAGMSFNNMDPQIYNQMNPRMPPPSSNPAFSGHFTPQQQLEAMQRAQGGRGMPNGNWAQGPQGQPPMVPPGQAPQPAQMGTPQPRNDMPPPQAVPASNTANGRPSSPAAPPTPQTANKAAPKGKKENKDKKNPGGKKKNSASASVAATPASEAENPPATPTPSTPITPSHPNSFGAKGDGQSQPNVVPNPSTNPAAQLVQPPQDPNAMSQFTSMDGTDGADININFSNDLNDPNILENFDFEQFLQGDDSFTFDPNAYEGDGGLEASMNDV